MADFKAINGLGASDLAEDLSLIMVNSYCKTDDPERKKQEFLDCVFEMKWLLEESTQFHSAIMRTAWWILNNRFEGKRTYILDSEGGIDFHTERVITEAEQNEAFAEFEAQQQRKTEMESETFGK